jgi:antitoxin (DNA-binding transcriptional repressor) of toxin-antitoxin stability system
MQNKFSASYFKTHCLKLLGNVYNHNDTIIVTKRGKDIAKIEPITSLSSNKLLFNSLSNKAVINDDIIETDYETWDVEND